MSSRFEKVFGTLLLTILLVSGFFAPASQPAAADGGSVQYPAPTVNAETRNPKLDSLLTQLASAKNGAGASGQTLPNNTQLAAGAVRVIVETSMAGADTRAALAGLGTIEAGYGDMLQMVVPVENLAAAANVAGVRFVRMPYHPVEQVASQGVGVINASAWQSAGYTGAGVKIGIIDGGFAGYSTRQEEGELPASVSTWWAPSIGGPGTSVHGTGVAEIIHDVAPGAQLYLANISTEVDLGNAVSWMISQGVNVISHSMGWMNTGPGNGTGPVNDIVANARAAGILWVNSAGNSAQMHWSGTYNDPNPGDTIYWHYYTPTDAGNSVYANAGDIIIVGLKWDDPWGTSTNDFDLYLGSQATTTIVAGSENVQNGTGYPEESFSYVVPATGWYDILISKYSATRNVFFHLLSFTDSLQYQVAAGSLTEPADSPNALAVGAVAWSVPGTIETFSSQGPTTDGRLKPDLVAPDGVSTSSYSPNPFYGTSASAPHTSGAAALVKQRYPGYSAAQLQSYLEGQAVDLGNTGKDNIFGSGRLNLGTVAGPPSVTTDNANNITATSATLHGTLNDLGSASSANVSFEWGTASGGPYPNSTSNQSMVSPGSFSAVISGLSENATYYFRAKAVGVGISYAAENSFATAPLVSGYSEILRPSGPGSETSIDTQYPASGAHWDKVAEATPDEDNSYLENKNGAAFTYQRDLYSVQDHTLTGGITNVRVVTRSKFNAPNVSVLRISLKTHGQVYEYEPGANHSVWTDKYQDSPVNPNTGTTWTWEEVDALEAGISLSGSDYSPDWSRVTQVYVVVGYASANSTPSAVTNPADNLTTTSARLNGALTSIGSGTTANVSFQWGIGSGNYTNETPSQSMNSTGNFSCVLSGLSSNTTYDLRAKAVGAGVSYGTETSFTTSPLVQTYSEILRPNGPGSDTSIDTQYPASGSHWDKVAEAIPDDDNSYIKNANGVAGDWQRDLFALTNHSGNGSINSVSVFIRTRHNISDAKASIRTHGVTYDSPGVTDDSFWKTYSYSWATNPFTGTAWTWNEIDALEAGVSLMGSSGGPDWSDATQVYVSVVIADMPLVSLAVTPPNPSITSGQTKQFSAIGTFSDNSTSNMTGSVTWTSANTTVATINPSGLATAWAPGTTNITATSGDINGWTALSVNQTPASTNVSVNAPPSVQTGADFFATIDITNVVNFDAANYDVSFDPSVFRLDDITDGAIGGTAIPVDIWNQPVPGMATVVQDTPGLAGVNGSGSLAVLHFHVLGSGGQTSNINLSNGVLSDTLAGEIHAAWQADSVSVASAPVGTLILRPNGPGSETSVDTQYPASGSHWDKVDEAVPDDDNSYIKNANGVAGSGQRDLFALTDNSGNGSINSVSVFIRTRHNISDAKASIRTHGVTYDSPGITNDSFWKTYSYAWATNPFTGAAWTWNEINTLEAGVSLMGSNGGPDWSDATQVYVSVVLAEMPLVSLAVTPPSPSVQRGETKQFTATGTFSDNSTSNITGSVTWTSSNTAVATINGAGLATTLAAGTTNITATSGNVSGKTTLAVTPAATVSVNNGNTITLISGHFIIANASGGVPIAVKDLPNLGAPANGLAGFEFHFTWNKNVVRVDSAYAASAPGWNITAGTPDNTAGTLTCVGFTTTYSTADITLLYLGITAVGNNGDNTTITVDIASLGDKSGNPISAIPVNAPVRILGQMAETSLSQGLTQGGTGVVVVKPTINRIKNLADNTTANITGGIGSYSAIVTGTPGIQLVGLNSFSPFNGAWFAPVSNGASARYGADNVTPPLQVSNTIVGELVPILSGSVTTSVTLTNNFEAIGAAGQPAFNLPGEQPNSMTFKRGNAKDDGVVDIFDALFIAQYLIGQRPLGQINALNAASPMHDGSGGDRINIFDALCIAQYVVGQRNANLDMP